MKSSDTQTLVETFWCGWCETEDVVSSFGLPGLWCPTWSTVTRTCPHCGEDTDFGMSNEKYGLLIHSIDDD
jgi:hypothetical protein